MEFVQNCLDAELYPILFSTYLGENCDFFMQFVLLDF